MRSEGYDLRRTEEAVTAAAKATYASSVDVAATLARAKTLQDELVQLRMQLRYLFDEGYLKGGDKHEPVSDFLWDHELPSRIGAAPRQNWDQHPEFGRLQATLNALRTDADAELPQ